MALQIDCTENVLQAHAAQITVKMHTNYTNIFGASISVHGTRQPCGDAKNIFGARIVFGAANFRRRAFRCSKDDRFTENW